MATVEVDDALQPPTTYERLTERFVKWAETQSDIRAAIVIGSRARVACPADEWSDLDIIVIVTEPERYLAQTDWLENIGNPRITFLEKTVTGDGTERRVLFAGGLDVDFAPISKKEVQQLTLLLRLRKRFPWLFRLLPRAVQRRVTRTMAEFSDIARRGMRVLLDKDGITTYLPLATAEPPSTTPPTPNEFLELVNDFWYHAVWTAKKLRRGELWVAKGCNDFYMKRLLLQMIEWHARAINGWGYDTWHRGRFLEQWADPRVVRGLRHAFAQYDESQLWPALLATMELFRWIAIETAAQLDFPYPTLVDQQATELVKALFQK
jgi:aminoglycoside 6-adenylyltransferase